MRDPARRTLRSPGGGFTLLELMIVVAVIAIVAAIAIPSLSASRKSANETAAIGQLKAIQAAQIQYRMRFGRYATSDEQLIQAGFISGRIVGTDGSKSGYVFVIQNPSPTRWFATARPETPGADGDRSFFTDVSGVVRSSLVGAAGPNSPPLD